MQRTLREKIFSIFLMTVMFLQSLTPYLSLIKNTYASSPIDSKIEYSTDSHQLKLSVNSSDDVKYLVAYKSEKKIEAFKGDASGSESGFSREFYAGTCSANEVCTPDTFKKVITKVRIETSNWTQVRRVVYVNGGFLTASEDSDGNVESLTQEEEDWLNNAQDLDLQPSATPTPTSEVTPSPTGDILDGVSVTATPSPTVAVDDGTIATEVVELNACLSNSLNGCVVSDKPDYHPNEVALINGYGFTPNTDYKLAISSDTNSYHVEYDIKSDENGSFSYSYQLENVYRPLYKVEVKDSAGNVVASTTFTDSDTSTLNPNGQGTYTAWTGSENDIDETGSPACGSSDGNDNISETVTGDRESVLVNLSSIPDGSTITSVNVTVSYRNGNDAGADNGTFQTFTRLNGTNMDSGVDLVATNTSCTEGTQTINVADTVKSGATTLEVGVLKTATDTSEVWVGTIRAVVTYSEAPKPDLTAVKTNDVNNSAVVGTAFTWKIHVTNGGTAAATYSNGTTIVSDHLPNSGATYGSPSASAVSNGSGTVTCSINGSFNLSCTAAGTVTINPGGYFDVTWSTTPTATGTLDNPRDGTCSVSTVTGESPTTNNSCSNSVTVSRYVAPNPSLPQSCGLDIALVIDNSDSIDSGELAQMKTAMNGFVTALNGTPTQYSVTKFGTTASVVQNFPGATASTAISSISTGGGYTNWQDGFTKAQGTFDPRANPNLVIFASDGNPNRTGAAGTSVSESVAVDDAVLVANALKTGGTRVMALGIGSGLDTPNLQAISGPNVGTSVSSDVITSDFSTLATDLQTYANSICGGTVTVNKEVDADGNGSYEGGNSAANTLGFKWGLDTGSVNRDMGTNEANVSSGAHTVTENSLPGYTFTGWYASSDTQHSCTNPTGATLPVNITTSSNVITAITLCNKISNGTIIVHKDVQGPNGENITDTSNNFKVSLDSGTGQDITDNSTVTFSNVSTGNHTITESSVATNYTLYGISTTSGQVGTPAGLVVNVGGGQTVHVYVTNRQKTGSISGFKFDSYGTGLLNWTIELYNCLADFSGCVLDDSTTTDNTGFYIFSGLNTGFYKVQEVVQAGWDALNGVISHNVEVQTGDEKTGNNFTNVQRGHLIVHKTTNPSEDLTEFSITATGSGTITNGGSGTVTDTNDKDYEVTTGTYSVTETAKDGWSETGNTCTNVVVAAGATEDCTITNTKLGKIIVEKQTLPDGSKQSFTFSADYSDDFNLKDGETNDSGYLQPGTYSVSETVPSGWNQTNAVCSDESDPSAISLQAGETVTCTFTNTQNGHLLVHKVTDPAGVDQTFLVTATGGTVVGSDSTLINADNDQYGDFEVKPGTFSVSETPETGWTEKDNTCTDIVVAAGATEECSITNTKLGKIIVEKQTLPDESTQIFNFTGDVAGAISDGEQLTVENVAPGVYTSTEDAVTGWNLSQAACDDNNSSVDTTTGTATFNVEAGETVKCTFDNTQSGKVIVTKYEDINGNGVQDNDEPTLPDWEINLDDTKQTTGKDGTTTFDVQPGEKVLSEDIQEGWTQTNISCKTSQTPPPETTSHNLCHKTSSEAHPWNALAVPDNNHVHDGHVDDYDYNGPVDKNGHPAQGHGADQNDPAKDGEAWCAANVPQKEAFNFIPSVYAAVTNEDPIDNDNNYPVTVDAGQTVTCSIGNKAPAPVLNIVKTNNTGGADKRPGQDVLFTLTVTATDSAVLNTEVVDLPAGGFTYRSGSWTATSSLGGAHIGDLELFHAYASPGIWHLGTVQPGEVITLTYVADISNTQQTGTYKDLAWTDGESLASAAVLGNESTGTFVGTDVKVITDPTTDTASITVKKEEKKTGDVLGAYLPATGADSQWMMYGIYGLAAGFLLLFTGLLMRSKKIKIGKYIASFIVAVTLSLSLGATQSQAATNLSVRLYQPDATTNKQDMALNYVTLDTLARGITAQCFKKGPSDAVFTQFGADNAISPATGNNANCVPGAAVLSATGTYQFFVRVTAGVDTVDSSTVSVNYVTATTDKPGTPYNYGKSKVESCKYRVSFHTADDGGKTVKVILYRSLNTSFGIDDSNKVGELAIGSNAEGYIDNTVDQCDSTYYYAIRAYDLFGKGSDVVGDNVTVTITEGGTTTTTNAATGETTGGALPASTSEVSKPSEEAVGETVLGTKTETNQKANILGVTTEKAQSVFKTLKDNPLATGVGIVLLAILIYVFIKKNPYKKAK